MYAKFNKRKALLLLTNILNVICDTYKLSNSAVGKILFFSTLTAIVATLLGLLIPVAIFLQSTSQSDTVKKATIQNRVVNFKALGGAFASICSTFLLWRIKSIRIVLCIAYCIGVCLIIQSLVKSIRWMADWSEEPQGFRNRQQEKLLKKSKLTESQRKLIWESHLKKITGIENKNSSQSLLSIDILDGFKENYEKFDEQDQLWMIKTTFKYSNLAYKKSGMYDGKFLNYSLDFTLKKINCSESSSDDDSGNLQNEITAWKTSIKEAFKLLAASESQNYLLISIVQKNTKCAKSKQAKKFLSQLILDSLYESKNPRNLNYGRDWQISSQSLSNNENCLNNRSILLDEFIRCIEAEAQRKYNLGANKVDTTKSGRVFESIFKNADPIFFGQLITLFPWLYAGVENNDQADIRCMLLAEPSIEIFRSYSIVSSNLVGDSDETQKKVNTFNIWMAYFSCGVQDATFYDKYINKLQRIFNVLLQENEAISNDDQHMLEERIDKLRATIQTVATLREKNQVRDIK